MLAAKAATALRAEVVDPTLERGSRDCVLFPKPHAADDILYRTVVRDAARRLTQQQILLGVDRLDYTKGIPEKLRAFREALRRYHELRGRITLIQVLVPSRGEIPEYGSLKARMRRLRQTVQRQDVFWRVNTFLEAAVARRLGSFPILEDYIPGRHDMTLG
jgi:hypothetical protein